MYQLRQPEDRLQKSVIDYLKLQHKGVVYYAIPNGYKKSAFEQWKSKVTGLVSGIPDIFIAKPTFEIDEYENSFYIGGLYLELKSAKGKLSETQKVQIEKLRKAGYKVEVVNCLDDAIKVIDSYLKM